MPIPHAAPRVTVVVPAYDGADLLPACLDSLAGQQVDGGFETLVIDNGPHRLGSTGATHAAIVASGPKAVRLIEPGRNLGFAGSAALAVREARSPLVVLLNQDARAEPGWLAALVEPFDGPDGDQVAAVTSKVLFVDGMVNNAGGAVRPDGYGYDIGFGEPDDGRFDQARDVPTFSGTAVALRVAAVREVGSFDARLFMYYEDTDLSLRLRHAGWRIRYQPTAVVRHLHAASSVVGSAQFSFWNERNRLLVLAKNAPAHVTAVQLARFAATTALLPLRRVKGAAIPDSPTFRVGVRLRVLGSFLRLLPSMLRGRR